MSQKKVGKIYCDEGVLYDEEFSTEAEAAAFVKGAQKAIELVDPDDDFHHVCQDTELAKDEE